jgi:3-oxoacyl-(acyl-carrier-protein) synthase
LVRVDVRAAAAFSCFGTARAAQVEALREGRTGLGPLGESYSYGGLWGAPIPGERTDRRPVDLTEQMADLIVERAGLTERERRGLAIFVGTTTGFSAAEEVAYYREKALGRDWKWQLSCGGPGRLGDYLARRLGSRAPIFTYTTACTSTAVGLLMAARMIRAGQVERALVFGLDLLMKISVDGFRFLQIYSETRCRPFDRRRDGLQLGEAVGALLLEPRGERGSRFELLDGAMAHDPSHIAAGSNDGRTASALMKEALSRSCVAPGEVTAIKAHGTGTPINDVSELRALNSLFDGRPPPFVSLKGALGHTLGASAAMETANWLACLEAGFVPPSCGFEQPSDEVPFTPLARPLPTEGRPGRYLFNSFGFGGTSVCYVVADHGAP